MAGPDVIAWLCPSADRADGWLLSQEAIHDDQNSAWHAPALLPPHSKASAGTPRYHFSASLRLTFSRPPKTDLGLVCGWDPRCDIVLPKMSGISFHHGAFTFDEHNRLIYRDLGSGNGTEIVYEQQGGGRRSQFDWILGGHPVPQGKTSITIHFIPTLWFQIVVCPHDITCSTYLENVSRFRQGTAAVEDLLGGVDLDRPPTEPASGVQSPPGEGPITLRKLLGEGGFGVVWHVWDVSTGKEHALKHPSARAVREGNIRLHRWREEARILGRVKHPHIVTLLGEDFTDLPHLELEYLPCGSLYAQANLTPRECLDIIRQCSSALSHLHHDYYPPIAHRDISPGNILVQHRRDDSIHVKLADFGLTKESDDFVTWCGTRRYLAPEFYEQPNYTPAIDVWSLGVVVMERHCGLPDSQAEQLAWCQAIADKLEADFGRSPDCVKEVLMSMVVMHFFRRSSAKDCHALAMATPDPVESGFQTPRPDEQQAGDTDAEDQQKTMMPQNGADCSEAGPLTVVGKVQAPSSARSAARGPTGQSRVSVLKRTRPPSSSSSSERHQRPKRDDPAGRIREDGPAEGQSSREASPPGHPESGEGDRLQGQGGVDHRACHAIRVNGSKSNPEPADSKHAAAVLMRAVGEESDSDE